MSDTCGLTSCEPFAKWHHDSQSWRTSEATSLWALTLSSLTLPQWGGLHNGELCEHPTPEHLISGPDYSSLPTPSAADGNGGGRLNSPGHQRTLPGTVRELLPTPAVNDMGRGKTPDEWDAWTAKMQAAHGNGNGHGKSLEIEAQRLLPTPTSQAAKHGELSPVEREGNRPQDRGNLWVVMPRLAEDATLPTPTSRDWKGANQRADQTCLHGAITGLQSPDGSASSDDPHQHQLSLDGLALPA